MGQVIGAIAVATFWIFITIVSVAAIMYDYRKKRLVVDTVRQAMEHGAQIDPVLLDRLLSHQKYTDAREQTLDPRLLKIGGIITIASGVGFLPLALFIRQIHAIAVYPIMGIGVLAMCVGVGLLISARVMAREPAPRHPVDRGA
jgi:hypothetical protein